MALSTGWRRNLGARLVAFEPRSAPWTVALRSTLAIVAPVAIGLLLGYPRAGLAATIGALTVSFADQPAPYGTRSRRLLLTSLVTAVAALAGFSLGTHTLLTLPLVAGWTFAACLLVALGPTATRTGLTSLIVLLITSARTELGSPLPAALLVLSGGLLQTLLAVLPWTLDRYRPQRRLLADAFVELAHSMDTPPDSAKPPPESDAINGLQEALLQRTTQRSLDEERFCILVAEYEQIRLALVAMSELLHGCNTPSRKLLGAWLQRAGNTLRATAACIEQDPAGSAAGDISTADMDAGLAGLEQQLADHLPGLRLRGVMANCQKLARHVRVVVRNGTGQQAAASTPDPVAAPPLAIRASNPWNILTANLRWHSVAFRHALRCMIVVTLCLAVARQIDSVYAYWFAMTAAIVLKPDFGATIVRGALRLAGTLVGLLVMSLLLYWLPPLAIVHVALFAALCFCVREWIPRHYGLGVAALSGMLVVMLALAGEPAMPVVTARLSWTVLGSLVGLGAYLFWPSWERRRVRSTLGDMLLACATYLQALCDADETAHARARRLARIERSNAQNSLERLRHEPRTGEGLLKGGEDLLIGANRLARVAMHLDAILLDRPGLREYAPLQELLTSLAGYTRQLTACLVSGQSGDPIHHAALVAHIEALREAIHAQPEYAVLGHVAERIEAITGTLDATVKRTNEPG